MHALASGGAEGPFRELRPFDVFRSQVDHVKEMWNGMLKGQGIMIRALDVYTNAIRSELRKFGGYEVPAVVVG